MDQQKVDCVCVCSKEWMQQYVLLYAWDCLLAVKFTSLERSVYLSH